MAQTTTADLGDTIPTIISEAKFTEQFKAIMRGLSWKISKGKGTTVNIPYFGEATSRQLTEGIDMTTSESMVDTNVQITPYEAGLKIILTDVVIEDDNEDLIRAAGRILGDAYEKKVDQDLLARLDNATLSMGAAGSTLTMGYIAAARANLQGNATSTGGPAQTPYVVVIHPFQELDIVDILTPVVPAAGTTQNSAGSMVDDVLAKYSVGRLFGMNVVSDGNLAIDTADDTKGGVFAMGNNGAIIYVSARDADVKPTRDESLRGVELVYVGRYGVGNYLNAWACELYTDATTPA